MRPRCSTVVGGLVLLVALTSTALAAVTRASAQTASPSSNVIVDDSALTYTANWATGRDNAASASIGAGRFGGSERYTSTAGRASYTFTGTRVRLFASTAPYHGIVRILLDGRDVGTRNLYSPTRVFQVEFFTSTVLSPGTHTVAMEWTGQKGNPAAPSADAVIDFVRYEQGTASTTTAASTTAASTTAVPTSAYVAKSSLDDNALTYTGTWGTGNDSTGDLGRFGGSDRWTTAPGAVASYRGYVTRIRLYASQQAWHGVMRIRLDGVEVATANLYAPSRVQQFLAYESPRLTPGLHTLTAENVDGRAITVDRVDVELDTGAAAPPVASTTTTVTTTSAPAGNASGRFIVVGKDIVDPNGNRFFPIGANVAPSSYVFALNGQTAVGRKADVLQWGWNTVRATTVCAGGSEDPYTVFNRFIAEYTAAPNPVVVIVECHDLTGKYGSPKLEDQQLVAQKAPAVKDLMVRLAERWKDNPYVWFNPLNEPIQSDDWGLFSALNNEFYGAVRAKAPYNLFIADIPGWAQNIVPAATTNVAVDYQRGKCNSVLAWHNYGAYLWTPNRPTAESLIVGFQQRNLPFIIGELGSDQGFASPPQFATSLPAAEETLAVAAKYRVGVLWWHATGDSNDHLVYSLKNPAGPFWAGGNGSNLSYLGQKFWDLSHRNALPVVRFDGDLRDSGCPGI